MEGGRRKAEGKAEQDFEKQQFGSWNLYSRLETRDPRLKYGRYT